MGMKNFGKTYKFEYGPHFWMSKTLPQSVEGPNKRPNENKESC